MRLPSWRRTTVPLALSVCALTAGVWVAAPAKADIDWSKAKEHWSFRPPQAHRPPAVRRKDWPKQPLDAFILARLEQARLAPSPEADPRTLIRRVTLDLTGLPPTPEEVTAFLREGGVIGDQSSVISGKPGSTPTFNAAAPRRLNTAYTRLVDRLLASPRFGERLASMWLPLARYGEDQAHQVGSDTKFFYPNAYLYRQWVVDAFNQDVPYDRFVKLQLAADSEQGASKNDEAALGFLGLGPKYYNRGRLDVMADEWQDRVDTVTRTFLGLTVACARCHDHKYDPVTMQDYYALAGVFAGTKMVNKTADGVIESSAAEAAAMRKDTLHVVEDDAPRDLNVFIRGNVDNKGPVVPRRFIQVLSTGDPQPFHEGSGRKELADSIASPGNPLTARVFVNRVWGLFFGVPLVGTPSNFGLIGDRPTHPELLDDLAVRFMKDGWSVKKLVREIVLSAAYRQGSGRGSGQPAVKTAAAVRDPQAVDPTNRLLWRMNRRRMTVEQWRDSVLEASGRLEAGGGPSQELTDPKNHKRTLYARISRLKLNDLLREFDYPDANVHAEKRSVTTTPMQKLFLLNSPFMIEQARALAARIVGSPNDTNAARVERAYLLLFNRPPTAEETRLAVDYLARSETAADTPGMSRWERYAQVLLASNEMFYVD